MLAVLAYRAWDAVSAGRAELLKAAAAYAWERARFARPGLDGEERYRRFCRLWDVTGELARQQALLPRMPRAEQKDRTATPPALEYRPGVGPSDGLIGFDARETFEGAVPMELALGAHARRGAARRL